jgi:hypothetical protein
MYLVVFFHVSHAVMKEIITLTMCVLARLLQVVS